MDRRTVRSAALHYSCTPRLCTKHCSISPRSRSRSLLPCHDALRSADSEIATRSQHRAVVHTLRAHTRTALRAHAPAHSRVATFTFTGLAPHSCVATFTFTGLTPHS